MKNIIILYIIFALIVDITTIIQYSFNNYYRGALNTFERWQLYMIISLCGVMPILNVICIIFNIIDFIMCKVSKRYVNNVWIEKVEMDG